MAIQIVDVGAMENARRQIALAEMDRERNEQYRQRDLEQSRVAAEYERQLQQQRLAIEQQKMNQPEFNLSKELYRRYSAGDHSPEVLKGLGMYIEKPNAQYRNVNGNIVQIDPTTGAANSVYSDQGIKSRLVDEYLAGNQSPEVLKGLGMYVPQGSGQKKQYRTITDPNTFQQQIVEIDPATGMMSPVRMAQQEAPTSRVSSLAQSMPGVAAGISGAGDKYSYYGDPSMPGVMPGVEADVSGAGESDQGEFGRLSPRDKYNYLRSQGFSIEQAKAGAGL